MTHKRTEYEHLKREVAELSDRCTRLENALLYLYSSPQAFRRVLVLGRVLRILGLEPESVEDRTMRVIKEMDGD